MLRSYELESVQKEADRWKDQIGPSDPYLTKKTIGIHDVLHAHFLLVDYFFRIGEGIGGVGPRDLSLLHSALGRQFVEFRGQAKWTDPVEICATLAYGLVKNHPFHDANKRTAFLVVMLHLQKVGRTPIATGYEFEDLMVQIAEGRLVDGDNERIATVAPIDDEIYAISGFLRTNTRNVQKRSKTITYNELQTILRSRGYRIQNPKGNRIDVVRTNESNGVLIENPNRVAHIGFPGWTKEVSRKWIAVVREATNMDVRHGFDSDAFFLGYDDPLSLVEKYREPLRRLAFR